MKNLKDEIKQLENELEPIILSTTMGEFSSEQNIEVSEDSKLFELRSGIRLIVDSFYEQWLEMSGVQQDLKTKNEHLNTSLQHLEQFTYVASHDLRSPLVNLRTLMDMKASSEDYTQHNLDEKIEDSLEKLESTLNSLIATISGSLLPKRSEDFDLKGMIENMCLSNSDRYKIDFDLELVIPNLVRTDKSRLKIIFEQLIANSFQFARPHEKVAINILFIRNNETCTVKYADNSLGLNLPDQEQVLFSLFQTSETGNVGRGIGMHSVKTAIEDMNGTIQAESKVGKGIHYTLTFTP
mmetsp:Transcript_36152/g.47494  ORF Transcript_36152/g.47494 Transcript_36152/m.47494 type:complete len:296 (+) Transcript_36152:387-1274(+)